MKVYLDVDDTLGAFREHCVARGVPRWEGSWYTTCPTTWTDEQHHIQSETNRHMEMDDFWLSMPIIPGAHELIAAAAIRYDAYLLTALPRTAPLHLKPRIKMDKTLWAERTLHVPRNRIIVCERPQKIYYAMNDDNNFLSRNLLIDDAEQNCDEWEQAGGVAYHFDGDIPAAVHFLKSFYGGVYAS